ncbi:MULTISPECIES: non-hydrolyzing UDP-N-acetylglucosamine 2-epimerase [Sphingomonas]|uniref:non-hydrolyzing UDP-N-acetylglucosamine 2-epimerase n=1 Tax=Sphingomonas TaxID=13687 RepID=UPI000DEFB7A0|nr:MULTISPECIES: UDP-N-acetylglucosamine 2-epimerase (non-hydrolyzing) [Sphingomonas]
MSFPSIAFVLGTRPEAIKFAPLAQAFEARGCPPRLFLTGQHPRLDLAGLGIGHLPAETLRCAPHENPIAFAQGVAAALAPQLVETDLVLVQGDTSSALGGALAAREADVPLAHVEAGLRSFDPALPWPEEENRTTIDRLASLMFAPTPDNAANLKREKVAGEVLVTGNTGLDALRRLVGPLPRRIGAPLGGLPRLLVTCHRRENWGLAFIPVAMALLHLARSPWLAIDVVLHPNPAMADTVRDLLAGRPRISLLPPLDHRGMVMAMRQSTIILSDSGGVQEEAPALGVPLLVLRSKTERPEGIRSGNSRLVGTDTKLIVDEVERLLGDADAHAEMALPALPFGDGHAAERIADASLDWLDRRRGQEQVRLSA